MRRQRHSASHSFRFVKVKRRRARSPAAAGDNGGLLRRLAAAAQSVDTAAAVQIPLSL